MTALPPPSTLRPRRAQPPLPSAHAHRSSQQQQHHHHQQQPRSFWGGQWSSLSTAASSVLSTNQPPPPRRRPRPSNVDGATSSATAATPPHPPPPKTPTPPPSPVHYHHQTRHHLIHQHQHQHHCSVPPQETLVYVYPVTAETTLSGVVIAFDTTASAVLRTNRLWPGDALQSRRELLIPVDDCRIRGLPLTQPEAEAGAGARAGTVAGGGGGEGGGAEQREDGREEEEEEEERGGANSAADEKRYRPHSRTLLPNNIGPTQVGVLLPRRAKRRKAAPALSPHPSPLPPPRWMTPGVHSFHPEEEAVLPEVYLLNWGEELLKGAELVGGRVEGWVRRLGDGLRSTTAELVGDELIEMVSGLGGAAAGDEPPAAARRENTGRAPAPARPVKGTALRRKKAD